MKNKLIQNYILELKKEGLSKEYIVAAAWAKRCENTSILEINAFVESL